jgi:hypothetical protein
MKLDIQPTKTETLIHRLNLMAEAGGMITKDRRRTIMEAAGRLSELDEAMRILTEQKPQEGSDVQ